MEWERINFYPSANQCGTAVVSRGEGSGRAFAFQILGDDGEEIALVTQLGASDVGTFPLTFSAATGNTFVAVLSNQASGNESLFDSLTGIPQGTGTLTLQAPNDNKSQYDLSLSIKGLDVKKGSASLSITASGYAEYTE